MWDQGKFPLEDVLHALHLYQPVAMREAENHLRSHLQTRIELAVEEAKAGVHDTLRPMRAYDSVCP